MTADRFAFNEEVAWLVPSPGDRYPDGSQVTVPRYGRVVLGTGSWVGVMTDGGKVLYFGDRDDAAGPVAELISTSQL